MIALCYGWNGKCELSLNGLKELERLESICYAFYAESFSSGCWQGNQVGASQVKELFKFHSSLEIFRLRLSIITLMTLGQVCATLLDSQSRLVVIQPGIKPGSVVTPLAPRCSALDRCATQEPYSETHCEYRLWWESKVQYVVPMF